MITSSSLRLTFALAALAVGPALPTPAHGAALGTSAFYRSHENDAIQWRAWGPEAFADAKKTGRPLYVFAGSLTSELSRAMHTQSFVNPQIITLLNSEFIPVLVDREDHPDLANYLQLYLASNKQMNGWPANVWFTPELAPFDGATYLPPSQEWGKEGILNVMQRIVGQWKASRTEVAQRATESVSTLKAFDSYEAAPAWDAGRAQLLLQNAVASWLQHYDPVHHGFGEAPRFLEPELLRSLLTQGGPAREAALSTLHRLAASPMHDVLEGGFFRRCVDAGWELPSFQKFAVDQARLVFAFTEAYEITKDPFYRNAATRTLDYLEARINDGRGLPTRARDYTSETASAAMAWTPEEVTRLIAYKAEDFKATYGIRAAGTVSADNDPSSKWKGKSLLSGGDLTAFKTEKGILLEDRNRRARPDDDSHTLTLDAAFTAAAFARAGKVFENAAWQKRATALLQTLKAGAWNETEKKLSHQPNSRIEATPDAYAAVILALAENGKTDTAWLQSLGSALQARFTDPASGRLFFTAKALPGLNERLHAVDPAPGEAPAAESLTIQAFASAGIPIPRPLLATLQALLDDPAGMPRGDLLLAATVALRAQQ